MNGWSTFKNCYPCIQALFSRDRFTSKHISLGCHIRKSSNMLRYLSHDLLAVAGFLSASLFMALAGLNWGDTLSKEWYAFLNWIAQLFLISNTALMPFPIILIWRMSLLRFLHNEVFLWSENFVLAHGFTYVPMILE